jgi:hypothetical protein
LGNGQAGLASGLTVFEPIAEPFGGAPQVVVACLDEFGGGLRFLGERRHQEALLREVAVSRCLEIGGIGITRNVVHGRCATRFWWAMRSGNGLIHGARNRDNLID